MKAKNKINQKPFMYSPNYSATIGNRFLKSGDKSTGEIAEQISNNLIEIVKKAFEDTEYKKNQSRK